MPAMYATQAMSAMKSQDIRHEPPIVVRNGRPAFPVSPPAVFKVPSHRLRVGGGRFGNHNIL